MFACAPLVKIGLNVLTNCSAFWLKTTWSMFPFAFHTLGELARYPISIYGVGVRLILAVVLPYAFMSYFPATAVLSLGSCALARPADPRRRGVVPVPRPLGVPPWLAQVRERGQLTLAARPRRGLRGGRGHERHGDPLDRSRGTSGVRDRQAG